MTVTNTNIEPKPESNIETITFASFELPHFIIEGLRRMDFEKPTAIQAEAIPALLSGADLVAQSQTGSGKTAAFAIPVLARLQRKVRELQALVIVPTRELALQVTQVFKEIAGTSVRITTIYGGAPMGGQIRGLQTGGYQVVVGTPGRLLDHLSRGTLRLNNLRTLVLDEADEMLDRGFGPDVEAIMQATPPSSERQTALFSATLPEWVQQTARKHLKPDHRSIKLSSGETTRPDIEHLIYDMAPIDKIPALRHLLNTNNDQSILVFARTKHGVKKLATKLEEEGFSAAGLQGNLSQKAREDVMHAFRHGRVRILVATNVGARGIDVSGISHVINFDLPENAELFTHRVGRTARNGASGTAITFLTGEDRPKWQEIERVLAKDKVPMVRKHWDGPRAGANEQLFTQPQQRGMGQPPRRQEHRSFESQPARPAAQRQQRERRSFEGGGGPNSGRPNRSRRSNVS